MKKNVDKFNPDKGLYLPPKCTAIDFKVEGVLCGSNFIYFQQHEGFDENQIDFSGGWN